MRKIVIITGLTASGKSSLAVEIAKKYNAEIISCDSVQIYKGLDIGSAKESKIIRNKVPHHLIDICEFTDTFNVSQFIENCMSSVEDILSRKKLPIIVGGTGMYVKALLEGYTFGEALANQEFRQNMQNLAKEEGNRAVWDKLYEKNSELANSVHPNNLHRVIRYLEIETFGNNLEKTESPLKDYEVCAIGVIEDREIIYTRINKRVDEMIDEGLEKEVKGLIDKGATRDLQSMNTIGYKEWFDYFENKTNKNQTVDLIKQHTRNYCKRQLTFLKTIKDVKLLKKDEAKDYIEEFLNDNNK
ncbi:MAG: tRNA (adenosine(37)-N6)-dimethylallyltransferase MiaA [Clostridiales bacterium]|nr:tRNA (adenosine(37)-N6)-dimethylallyltransferase MiaA [Clostridiales bacterium]